MIKTDEKYIAYVQILKEVVKEIREEAKENIIEYDFCAIRDDDEIKNNGTEGNPFY